MCSDNLFRTRACALLALVALALFAPAAGAGTISYELAMCEDLNVLNAPDNPSVAANAGWKTQHTLMLERTMPFLELRNTAEQGDITQLTLSIGDATKNFDWAKMLDSSPGVTFEVTTIDAIVGGLKSDTLQINFTGLGPGEFVRFRTGLSHDSGGSGLVDFRETWFNFNGRSDPARNSLVQVQFSGSQGQNTLEKKMPNFKLPVTGLSLGPVDCKDFVVPLLLTDEGDMPPGGPEVPEPGSITLLAAGMIGLAIWRIRRRR